MSWDTLTPENLPETYDGLLQWHVLRPIHDATDYDNAVAALDALSGLPLNPEQAEYLEAVSILIEAYEREHVGFEPTVSGVAVLRYLCQENAYSGSKLAGVLGVSRAMGVKLLSGERRLTVNHINKLSKHFKVAPNVFLN